MRRLASEEVMMSNVTSSEESEAHTYILGG